jgi:hypothetical protein
MSRAAFVVLLLLTIPHVAEARASSSATATRPVLICENHTSSLLKNLEMESFCILAGGCWGGAVELDVILQPGVGFDAG